MLNTGHFHLAKNRTFLLCLDSDDKKYLSNAYLVLGRSLARCHYRYHPGEAEARKLANSSLPI